MIAFRHSMILHVLNVNFSKWSIDDVTSCEDAFRLQFDLDAFQLHFLGSTLENSSIATTHNALKKE